MSSPRNPDGFGTPNYGRHNAMTPKRSVLTRRFVQENKIELPIRRIDLETLPTDRKFVSTPRKSNQTQNTFEPQKFEHKELSIIDSIKYPFPQKTLTESVLRKIEKHPEVSNVSYELPAPKLKRDIFDVFENIFIFFCLLYYFLSIIKGKEIQIIIETIFLSCLFVYLTIRSPKITDGEEENIDEDIAVLYAYDAEIDSSDSDEETHRYETSSINDKGMELKIFHLLKSILLIVVFVLGIVLIISCLMYPKQVMNKIGIKFMGKEGVDFINLQDIDISKENVENDNEYFVKEKKQTIKKEIIEENVPIVSRQQLLEEMLKKNKDLVELNVTQIEEAFIDMKEEIEALNKDITSLKRSVNEKIEKAIKENLSKYSFEGVTELVKREINIFGEKLIYLDKTIQRIDEINDLKLNLRKLEDDQKATLELIFENSTNSLKQAINELYEEIEPIISLVNIIEDERNITPRINLARKYMGASIIKQSPTYGFSGNSFISKYILGNKMNPAEMMLTTDLEPGKCWCCVPPCKFMVSLYEPWSIDTIGFDFPDYRTVLDNSRMSQIEAYCNKEKLGRITTGSKTSTIEMKFKEIMCQNIEFKVITNKKQPFVCLYRLRIHPAQSQ
eukprot:TRINITY_DN3176_c1_g1_i1.p1 TRINITY_DN3176_c1_g1~~TRINITY_DN3176_c1_g1_i1.p1  ORF type:complete len:617 (+),score=186.70 TRINITY_DN3176_c1_g1_i1:28-1878(+)